MKTLDYFIYSWAIVGISFKGAFSPGVLDKGKGLKDGMEQYVIRYMNYWQIIKIEYPMRKEYIPDDSKFRKGIIKIENYIHNSENGIQAFPKFYISFLNQLHIGCDADGFSDVFCF
ncbi:MAG: hypothetical protein LUG18_15960 [Candidatus Azobacteroides sp.]|nr:hypothetical protein [Candidatus Azobacteroides sp.]